MSKKKLSPPPAARKPRADAERNRILEVAKEVFTRDGAAASLDDIAQRSDIGNATLYRHFPTRDALIEAVYRSEVEKLATAEQEFAATMPPVEALRAWMLLLIDHIAGKQLILPALNTVAGGSVRLFEGARSIIHTAFVASVNHAVSSGDFRADTNPEDFVRALVGIFHATALPDWEQSARRLVDILIAGSQRKRRELGHETLTGSAQSNDAFQCRAIGHRELLRMSGKKLAAHPIHLGLGAKACTEPEFTGSIDWYAGYVERHQLDGVEGRLVSVHTFQESWNMWEMHPHGCEVVLCTAGTMTLHQERADGSKQSLQLGPGDYAINEPGTWHSADVVGQATALFITAGAGTQHRPR